MLLYKKINYFLRIILVISTLGIAHAQVKENVDPTVAQFPIIRGSGDPDYTGDLNVSIPLMTVPGNGGLNFDITLQYIFGNGVPISESASWVGLGWNLNMYEITCNPVNGNIGGAAYYYYRENSTKYIPDFYNLSCPAASTSFWLGSNTGTSEIPDLGIMQKWSGIKIEAYKSSSNALYYDYFIVYGNDGTRYVYKDKLKKDVDYKTLLLNHNMQGGVGNAYYYVYKLSAILSSDYKDVGGDPNIPDDYDSGLNLDYGGWIRFKYSTPVEVSSPYSNLTQQISYLEKVISPTHTAEFLRYATTLNPFIINNRADPQLLSSLLKIVLKRNHIQDEISSVRFYQLYGDNGFNWLVDDGTFSFSWASDNAYRLRPKLESIKIFGKNSVDSLPAYNFSYYETLPAFPPPYYIDSWGYLTNEYAVRKPQNYFTYGMLKSITYPTGGKNSFEYESDYFQADKNSFRNSTNDVNEGWKAVKQGGLRLRRQIITDPQTSQNQVYEYFYGQQNVFMKNQYELNNLSYPGVGFISSDPGLTQDYIPFFSINNNIRNDVHYPDVTILQPDGSKIIKYFTSSCTEVQLFNSSSSQNGDYYKIFRDNFNNNKIVFTNMKGEHTLSTISSGSTYQPYIYVSNTPNEGLLSKSSHESGSPFIDYFGLNQYSFEMNCYSSADLNNIILGETRELDDCNTIFNVFTNQSDNPEDYYSVRVRIAGLDNGWKRGYITREEKYKKRASANEWDLVTATDFYYEMILKNLMDYTITSSASGWPRILFSALSGWAKLVKQVETTY